MSCCCRQFAKDKNRGCVLLAVIAALFVSALPVNAQKTVEQWGICELALHGPTNGNPFVDVNFGARFVQGDSVLQVPGFYDGDGIYRVRFMPEKRGDWKYTTESSSPELAG